ncbi:MAG: YbbR-like domain-containing protein [Limnochordia bacterium]|jgi:YbbR domain-containing protein
MKKNWSAACGLCSIVKNRGTAMEPFDSDMYTRFFALFLAIILWFMTAAGSPTTVIQQELTVPVEAVRMAEDAVVSLDPGQVKVVLRGGEGATNRLDRVRAFVDVEGQRGRETRPVEVTAPMGLQILRVLPGTVQVNVEIPMEKEVPVQVALLSPDHRSFDIQVAPQRVTIRGTAEQLAGVTQGVVFVSLPPEVPALESSFVVQAVNEQGQPVRNVQVEPSLVEVQVEEIILQPHMVPVKPVLVGQPAAGWSLEKIEVFPREVTIYLPANMDRELTSVATKPVSIEGAQESFRWEVPLEVPLGGEVYPTQVEIKVEIVTASPNGA